MTSRHVYVVLILTVYNSNLMCTTIIHLFEYMTAIMHLYEYSTAIVHLYEYSTSCARTSTVIFTCTFVRYELVHTVLHVHALLNDDIVYLSSAVCFSLYDCFRSTWTRTRRTASGRSRRRQRHVTSSTSTAVSMNDSPTLSLTSTCDVATPFILWTLFCRQLWRQVRVSSYINCTVQSDLRYVTFSYILIHTCWPFSGDYLQVAFSVFVYWLIESVRILDPLLTAGPQSVRIPANMIFRK